MIEFLMAHWLLFLIIMISGMLAAIVFQLLNIKKSFNDNREGFFKRFGLAVIFGGLGSLGGIALFVSVILNAIEYFS